MSVKLPPPLAAYFSGVNEQAFEVALELFSEEAVVQDEGRERRGRAAIREWIEETTTKYRPTIAVRDVAEGRRDTTVTATVSGDFPGSPVELRFAFLLDGGKSTRLEVTG